MSYLMRYFVSVNNDNNIILRITDKSIITEKIGNNKENTIYFGNITEITSKVHKELIINYKQINRNESISIICQDKKHLMIDLLKQKDQLIFDNSSQENYYQSYIIYNSNDFNQDQNDFYFDKNEENEILTVNYQNNLIENEDIIYEINLQIINSILIWKELKTNEIRKISLGEIEQLKTFIYKNVNAILILTTTKLRLIFIPKKQKEINNIIKLIQENGKKLNLNKFNNKNEYKYPKSLEYFNKEPMPSRLYKDAYDNDVKIDKIMFLFANLNRVIFKNIKIGIDLSCDGENLYETLSTDLKKNIISKISLSEIQYMVLNESFEDCFEFILKDNTRIIYDQLNYNKQSIIAHTIEAIWKSKNISNDFSLLSNSPKIEKKIKGYDEDCYKRFVEELIKLFISPKNQDEINELIEEMAINFVYININSRDKIFKSIKKKEDLYDKIYEQMNSSIKILQNDKKEIMNIHIINSLLLIIYNLGQYEKNDEKLKNILIDCLKLNYSSIFFNTISNIKNLMKIDKKEIIPIISKEFFSKYLSIHVLNYSEENYRNFISHFESKGILDIICIINFLNYILDKGDSYLYEELLDNIKCLDSLFLYFKLLRCKSNILIGDTLEIFEKITKKNAGLKKLIMSKTLLFFQVLLIFLKNELTKINKLSLTFLTYLVINYKEHINLVKNLFPETLFLNIETLLKNFEPNLLNWTNEWEIFFNYLKEDNSTITMIWDKSCRDELIEKLEILIQDYEEKINKSTVLILSFKECSSKESTRNLFEKNDIKISPMESIFSFFLNNKEIKFEYDVLKDQLFVGKYYLGKLNEDEKNFNNIKEDYVVEFNQHLKEKLSDVTSEKHISLILITMIRLYKIFYEKIKECNFEFLLKFYNSTSSIDIKNLIIQFFLTCISLDKDKMNNIKDRESNKDVALIKEQNVKNLVKIKEIHIFLDMIKEFLKSNINKNNENLFDIDIEKLKDLKCNLFYIDNIGNELKNKNTDEEVPCFFDFHPIDKESYDKSPKKLKIIIFILMFYKLLLENCPLTTINNNNQISIAFPLPRIRNFFYDEMNYKYFRDLLLIDNENLLQTTLELFLYFINDSLTYSLVSNKFCIVDILFFYMIKYKSKTIFDTLQNFWKYHKLFFGFDKVKLYKDFLLNDEEKEYVRNNPETNLFFLRYFPLNIVYYISKNSFEKFMELLTEEKHEEPTVIWNREMFKKLLESVKYVIEKSTRKNKMNNNSSNSDIIFNTDDMEFIKNYRPDYYKTVEINNNFCYLYYLKFVNDIKQIDESDVDSMISILANKLKNENLNIDIIYLNILYQLLLKRTNNLCVFEEVASIIKQQFNNIIKKGISDKFDIFSYLVDIILIFDENLINYSFTYEKYLLGGVKFILSMEENLRKDYENLLIKILEHIINKLSNKKEREYDSKLIRDITRLVCRDLFQNKDKQKLLIYYLDFYKGLLSPWIENDIKEYLINTSFPYQLVIICIDYDKSINQKEISLAYNILKKLVCNENFNSIFKKLLGDFLFESFTKANKEIFLEELSKVEESFIDFINKIIFDIQSGASPRKTKEKKIEFKSYDNENENELKVNNIYLILYNNQSIRYEEIGDPKDFTFKLSTKFINGVNELVNKIKENNRKDLNIDSINERLTIQKIFLYSLSKCVEESKSNYLTKIDLKSLENKENLIEAFFNYLKIYIEFKDELDKKSKTKTKKHGNSLLNININESIDLICINFMKLMALDDKIKAYTINERGTVALIQLIENENSKKAMEYLYYLFRALRYEQNLNLVSFIFLLKKLIKLNENHEGQSKEDVKEARFKILEIINLYSKDNQKGSALNLLYEMYLPDKIVENLFHLKEVNEPALKKWLDKDLELPDLIWNKKSLSISINLLENDCKYILEDVKKDIKNIKKFPVNFFNRSQSNVFFEIEEEFKIKNIYLRLFNKQPYYNIGINLVNFLETIYSNLMSDLKVYFTISCNIPPGEIDTNFQLLHQKIITLFTSLLLVIEQINFNDYNNNLGIASEKEFTNLINNEENFQKSLITLIQKSFEFQKYLSENLCKKILDLQTFFYDINSNNENNNKFKFSNDILLIYLQILYLICSNRNRIDLFVNEFDFTIIDYYLKNIDNSSDYEIILLICIIKKLFSKDTYYISLFLINYLKDFVEISKKRKNTNKYIEMLLAHILLDTQYGQSLRLTIKSDEYKEYFSDNGLKITKNTFENIEKLSEIWRKSPETLQDVISIYSNQEHYINDDIINQNININIKEDKIDIFPIIPKNSINYFCYKDLNIQLLKEKYYNFKNNNSNIENNEDKEDELFNSNIENS